MTVTLMTNLSENKVIDKVLQEQIILNCVLKEATDTLNPTIVINKSVTELTGINYAYIPAFGRYYYTEAPVSLTNNTSSITMHVDVLKTYSDEIKSQTAIVNRGERNNTYNLDINDGSLKVYQDKYVITKAFPNSFSKTNYVLLVAGGTDLSEE